MDQPRLQKLIEKKKEIQISYRPEKDEITKSYRLEPIEIKAEYLKDGGREIYLYATKLPKGLPRPKIQKFILSRILSAS